MRSFNKLIFDEFCFFGSQFARAFHWTLLKQSLPPDRFEMSQRITTFSSHLVLMPACVCVCRWKCVLLGGHQHQNIVREQPSNVVKSICRLMITKLKSRWSITCVQLSTLSARRDTQNEWRSSEGRATTTTKINEHSKYQVVFGLPEISLCSTSRRTVKQIYWEAYTSDWCVCVFFYLCCCHPFRFEMQANGRSPKKPYTGPAKCCISVRVADDGKYAAHTERIKQRQ